MNSLLLCYAASTDILLFSDFSTENFFRGILIAIFLLNLFHFPDTNKYFICLLRVKQLVSMELENVY